MPDPSRPASLRTEPASSGTEPASTAAAAAGSAAAPGSSAAAPAASLRTEIAVEQRHLDRVYARLTRLRQEARHAERDGYRLASVGNYGALVERDAMVHHVARRRARLDAEHEGLVFGRLDRRGGGVEYVGRLGVRDADSTPLVIDWRAPAAGDFYQATPADPRDVLRRRMIRSRGETVVGVDDDLLDPAADLPVVGDGALLASLTKATGHEMRPIVATIQREQDAAIRAPATGATIVAGGPGTGKTAVALHRAAYLMYRHRSRFAAGGVLVVGPTPVFMRYISTVLPSLGEQEVTLRALGELVEGVAATRLDPPDLAALKGSLRMVPVLRRAARDQVPGAPTTLRLPWRGTLLRLDAEVLERIRTRALAGRARRNESRRAAFDGIFDALWEDAQAQLPSHQDRAQFEDDLTGRDDFREFLRAWWPLLAPGQVLSWLADPGRLARYASGELSGPEVAALAAALAQNGAAGPTVADVALLDELDQLLGRPARRRRPARDPYQVAPGVREVTTTAERAASRPAPPTPPAERAAFAHLVVDEAQDISPMQWRMLGRRGRRGSWTVVGDPHQSALSGDPAELARARDRALPRTRHDHTLTTNYRNPAEIFALAATVIHRAEPDAELPVPVRTTGITPVHRVVEPPAMAGAVRAAAVEVADQVEGTIGVITPPDRAAEVTGWLAGVPDPAGRRQVVNALAAKGLEYDAVVLVEPGAVEAAAGARTLYVALTRATQRLTTVATARWR